MLVSIARQKPVSVKLRATEATAPKSNLRGLYTNKRLATEPDLKTGLLRSTTAFV